MSKNDIFNFRRFGKYFASDFRTCTSNYGLSLLTISILIPVALYALSVIFSVIFMQSWSGPQFTLRLMAFFIAVFCIMVTMPVKCYGRITERKYGSFWVSLPASKLEKFLSMIIHTCFLVPIIGITLHLGVDWLICIFDKTCEGSMIVKAVQLIKEISNAWPEAFEEIESELMALSGTRVPLDFLKQMLSPWLYIDEYIVACLPFLLGAIYFKRAKTVFTFLALYAFSTITSIIVMVGTPFIAGYYMDMISGAVSEEELYLQMFNSGIFKHLLLIDILSDSISIIAMLALTWWRIKTLKH